MLWGSASGRRKKNPEPENQRSGKATKQKSREVAEEAEAAEAKAKAARLKNRNALHRAIPTLMLVCHSFCTIIIYHLEICVVLSSGIFWHYILAFYLASILTSFVGIFLAFDPALFLPYVLA